MAYHRSPPLLILAGWLFFALPVLWAVQPAEEPSLDRGSLAVLGQDGRVAIESALARRDYRVAADLLEGPARRAQSAKLLALLGGIRFLAQQYQEAAKALELAQSFGPLVAANRFTLAMAYLLSGERSQSRRELGLLIQDQPANALYRYWMGRLVFDEQRYVEAMTEFETALTTEPNNVRARTQLGLCQEALGRETEAIDTYRVAIRSAQKGVICASWPSYHLAALLRKTGQSDQAEMVLRKALQCAPRFAEAHYQLGLVLEEQGLDLAAEKSLRDAVLFRPAYPEPYYALGRILRRRGNVNEANEAQRRFEELSGGSDPRPAR